MKTKFFLIGLTFALMQFVSPKLFAQCQAGFTFTASSASATFTNTSTGYTLPVFDWNFGDSQQDYSANPTHFYNAAGTYTVTLTVYDSLTQCQSSYSLPVTVTAGCNNLTAIATSTNATICTACDGTLTGSLSGGTSPYNYSWSNSSNAASQTNICPGDYVLTVTDAIGCISSTNAHVGCPDTCHAGFNTSVSGNTVYVNNTSNDSASNVTFQWSFGDATSSNITNPVFHAYATAGTYTITLVMVDSLDQCTDTTWSVVTVGGPNSCSAYFGMAQDSFNLGLWYIYPSVSGQAPISYLWDFGDTTTSTQTYPTHNYAYACHHVVCLTITDANLCSSTYCDSSMNHRVTSGYMTSLTVVDTAALGIIEQHELKGAVFPNPVCDLMSVSFNKNVSGIIRVMNVNGKLISEQKFDGQKIQMDVSKLPSGIYNLSFSGESELWNQKFVIIH